MSCSQLCLPFPVFHVLLECSKKVQQHNANFGALDVGFSNKYLSRDDAYSPTPTNVVAADRDLVQTQCVPRGWRDYLVYYDIPGTAVLVSFRSCLLWAAQLGGIADRWNDVRVIVEEFDCFLYTFVSTSGHYRTPSLRTSRRHFAKESYMTISYG